MSRTATIALGAVACLLGVGVLLPACGQEGGSETSSKEEAGQQEKKKEAPRDEESPEEEKKKAKEEEEHWEPPRFEERREERHRMVARHIARASLGAPAVGDRAVQEAMRRVPRHLFVPPRERPNAYQNRPLPIGEGQTISQPYIVALMTELLELKEGERVLEIGTGSGYQAAVLCEITPRVSSIEILEPLAAVARERLQGLGYSPVEVRQGDGYYGWGDRAPFDGIIVTCAAGHVPPPLVQQLKPGGRMVIPVGPPYATQRLMVVTKDEGGEVRTHSVMPVRFVPMTGRAQGQR